MKILRAWWHTQSCIGIVFDRDIKENPKLSLKINGSRFTLESRHVDKNIFAEYTSYYVDDEFVHFCINSKNFYNIPNDDIYICGSFNDWGDAIGNEVWRMQKSSSEKFEFETLVPISFFSDKRKKYYFKFACNEGRWLHSRSDAPNIEFDEHGNQNLRLLLDRGGDNLIFADFNEPFDIRIPAIVCDDLNDEEAIVDCGKLLLELHYKEKLGVLFTGEHTEFSIFAPRAEKVELLIRKKLTEEPEIYLMNTKDNSLWQKSFKSDLHGKLYSYKIYGANNDGSSAFDPSIEIIDPYAHACLSRHAPAVIAFEDRIPNSKIHFNPPRWNDLVIVEAHVRDVLKNSSDLNESEKLGFKGITKLLQKGESYFQKLGANCVELQPIQEFDNENKLDYHWGYMPVNWFSPSSSYGSGANNLSQCEEFAEMVDEFHKNKISVILDVVYNHVGEPNNLLRIDKEYYFETSGEQLVNFSGCGNDFRANTPMGKRLIIDSLKFFVEKYNIDGFRFDLAELLGIEVLKEIETELKKIKPSIILIAEPWSFRGHIIQQIKETGFSSWNDGFREYLKNYVLDRMGLDGIKYYLKGSPNHANWPAQTVNYIESHDDMLFLDRITANYETPSLDDIKKFKMGYAITLLSIGVPMIHEGCDLLRTKYGHNNTYLDGEMNALNYLRGEIFSDVRDWIRDLIKFRLSVDAKALKLYSNVRDEYFRFFSNSYSNAIGILFNADRSLKAKQILAFFNPSNKFQIIPFSNINPNDFIQIADSGRFNVSGLKENTLRIGEIIIPPNSTYIFLSK